MNVLFRLSQHLLLEQDTKIDILRKSIEERIPVSIYYRGPAGEVKEGQRIDIEPVVLGQNARSGNLVIWAYVFKGVTKTELPGWKMFRVDRITSARLNYNVKNFKLGSLPGYERGKAPDRMRSLSSVEIYSPYWYEDDERFTAEPKAFPDRVPEPDIMPHLKRQPKVEPEPGGPIVKPSMSRKDYSAKVYRDLQPLVKDVNGQKMITKQDYDTTLQNLYNSKEAEFKIYQRAISGNERPGEGTRKRFTDTSKAELDKLLSRDNIQIEDNNNGMIAEGHRIQSRIKRLINW